MKKRNSAKIAVTAVAFSKNAVLKGELAEHFPNCTLNEEGRRYKDRELVNYLKGAEGAIVGLEKMDGSILKECTDLKIVSKYGVGLDNIDAEYCNQNDICIGWAPGVNKTSVAEMTLAFMIMLERNIFLTANQLKKGIWNKDGGYNLSEKTVGIIGAGNIGKKVAELLKPFACKVLVNDIVEQAGYYRDAGLIEASKEEIFKTCDIVTIHTPLTEQTKYLINKETLKLMKQKVFLINTARGAIFKEDDLKWALQTKTIAGAAIDVYEEEPPGDVELLSLPNLICTPHIGGNSQESVLAMGRSAIEHLREYFER